jgi:hypothetical protein
MASILCYAVAAYNQVTESHELTQLSAKMCQDAADIWHSGSVLSLGKHMVIAHIIVASPSASA